MTPASTSQIVKLMDHDRAVTTWVCRAVVGEDGTPKVERIARIIAVYPRDGAGRLRACVTDWGNVNERGEPAHFAGHAGGYGYDKRTAVLEGATVGGIELGDHCDHKGRPILRDLARSKGWEIIGDGF